MKKSNNIVRNNTGLTLIEVIVAMTILGIISGTIFYMFNTTQFEFLAGSRDIDAQGEASKSIQYIVDDLRGVESQKLSDKTTNAIEINGSNNMLIIHYEDSLGHISNQVAYGINNKTLYRYVLPGNNELLKFTLNITLGKVIARNVETFSVIDQGSYYEINLVIDPPNVGKRVTRQIPLSTKFTPRYYEIR